MIRLIEWCDKTRLILHVGMHGVREVRFDWKNKGKARSVKESEAIIPP